MIISLRAIATLGAHIWKMGYGESGEWDMASLEDGIGEYGGWDMECLVDRM